MALCLFLERGQAVLSVQHTKSKSNRRPHANHSGPAAEALGSLLIRGRTGKRAGSERGAAEQRSGGAGVGWAGQAGRRRRRRPRQRSRSGGSVSVRKQSGVEAVGGERRRQSPAQPGRAEQSPQRRALVPQISGLPGALHAVCAIDKLRRREAVSSARSAACCGRVRASSSIWTADRLGDRADPIP